MGCLGYRCGSWIPLPSGTRQNVYDHFYLFHFIVLNKVIQFLLTDVEDEPFVPIANHVVQIGIDGLKPDCIKNAPGGAPNILGRLSSVRIL